MTTPPPPPPPLHAPAALFCANCGRPLEVGAAFCRDCGTRVAVRAYEPPRSIEPTVVLGSATYELAPFWPRVGAFLIDGAVQQLVVGPFALLFNQPAFGSPFPQSGSGTDFWKDMASSVNPFLAYYAITFLVVSAMSLAFESYGWSPGKGALGFRVVRQDGYRPGWVHGLARGFWKFVGLLPFLLGYLWAAWDPQRQAWHDKGARTYVVRWPAKYGAANAVSAADAPGVTGGPSLAPAAPTLALGVGVWTFAALQITWSVGFVAGCLALAAWLPDDGPALERLMEDTFGAPPPTRSRP